MNRTIKLMAFAILVMLASPESKSYAATVLADGNGAHYGGDCTFACVDRYQQIYSSNLFNQAVTISAVSFIATGATPTWGNGEFQMSLSTSSKSVDGLSHTFANNIGSDVSVFETRTFSGTVIEGELFGFSGSFFYDPTLGNLLIDVILTAGVSGGPYVRYNDDSDTNGEYSRVFSFSGDPAGSVSKNYGNHTIFEISAVPVPAALPLFGTGLALMGFLGWRKKRKAS